MQNRNYLDLIDINTPGPRNDVTPLFSDHQAFVSLVEDLSIPFADSAIDLVAGIDALGFILGAAIALRLEAGFLPLRKGGKLPVDADRVAFVDYSGGEKTLELRKQAIHSGARVLVVDEWVETGAQVSAAVELIEKQGGVVAGIASIQIDDTPGTQRLQERFFCHKVWRES